MTVCPFRALDLLETLNCSINTRNTAKKLHVDMQIIGEVAKCCPIPGFTILSPNSLVYSVTT